MRLRAKTGVAILGISCALGGIAITGAPMAHAEVRSAAITAAATRDAGEWVYAGKYYSWEDCQASGQEELDSGADRFQCDPEIDPDGSIAYWSLWVLYAD